MGGRLIPDRRRFLPCGRNRVVQRNRQSEDIALVEDRVGCRVTANIAIKVTDTRPQLIRTADIVEKLRNNRILRFGLEVLQRDDSVVVRLVRIVGNKPILLNDKPSGLGTRELTMDKGSN